jgi:hypothetical protein
VNAASKVKKKCPQTLLEKNQNWMQTLLNKPEIQNSFHMAIMIVWNEHMHED